MEQLCKKCLLPHALPGQRRQQAGGKGCPICGKPRAARHRYCPDCRNQYARGHRKPLTGEALFRKRARDYVHIYLKRGHIQKLPCVACDAPPEETVAHHHNGHDWPLEVIWVCVPHHLDLHAGRSLSTG